jgi:hypothetical protein
VLLLVSCSIWFDSHSYGAMIVFALLMGMGYG